MTTSKVVSFEEAVAAMPPPYGVGPEVGRGS